LARHPPRFGEGTNEEKDDGPTRGLDKQYG
jgi:hypothetical protein